MKCVICKQGEIQPGTTTMTLERDATTVVFKNVPAEVCQTEQADHYLPPAGCGGGAINRRTTDGRKGRESSSSAPIGYR